MSDQPPQMTPAELKGKIETSTVQYLQQGLSDGTIPPAGLVMISITDYSMMLEVKATIDQLGTTNEGENAAITELEVSVREIGELVKEADQ